MPRFALPLALIASAFVAAAAAQTPTVAGYRIVKEVPLGAPDRWDYVVYDAPSHRVYVAHLDRLSVVDGRSGKLIGEVTGIPGGTHGTGISGGKGYTDDGQAGVAVVFDTKTLKVLKTVAAQKDADGIAVDPATGRVFVVSGDAKNLTVIDPKTDQVVATIDGGGKLEYAVAGPGGRVYVNGSEKQEIVRVDTRTNTVDARWPLVGCVSPHGLAIDPVGHRLFSTCFNQKMMVVNTDTGAVVATLPIGMGTDGAAFDPIRKRAFSSNGDGTLTVVQARGPDSFTVAEVVQTRVSGKTMGVDPGTGRLYIAAADVDPAAPVLPGVNGGPPRPTILPGTLKLLFLDPVR